MTESPFLIADEHAGDRLMRQQAMTSTVHLAGETPPTRRQVAAVLHALSDHTQLMHLLSDDVAALAADFGVPATRQADGVGRYLHGVADHLRGAGAGPERTTGTPEQRWPLRPVS